MQFRLITSAAIAGTLAWGAYKLSGRDPGQLGTPFNEVLAAAGGEAGFLASSQTPSSSDKYRISALSVFSNVALHVKDNYVDPKRIHPKEMLVAALKEVERQVAEILVEELGNGRIAVQVMDKKKIVHIDDVESLWEINLKLREIFRFFEKHIPPQDDVRAVEYAAVNGALSTLDPHSVLLKPEAFAEMKTHTKGEFGGLGIVISIRDAKLTIISPLEGTPAWRAGLKAGDVISRIGDVSTVSMAIEEAVQMLRGVAGSKVAIWVDRKGWTDARKFVITRERIKIESVESQLLSDNVGYIKIKNFQQNTGKDLRTHLKKLSKKTGNKLKGLVLDLRNNPGGLLEQAIRVSDKFLTSGDIVTTVGYGNKLREPKRARWSGTESKLPIAVLVNKGSASASEIVAGALKNLDRAVVFGERTFGKGSVQVLYDFADSSALKLTIAQYLTPGGISIQNEGVAPDIELKPAWLEKDSVRLFYEPKGHREKSLDKHLEKAGVQAPKQAAPKVQLTYLLERKDPEEEAKEPPKDINKFEEDDPIKIARKFLSAAGAPTRSLMLKRGEAFLERQRREIDRQVEKRMSALDVDWSQDPKGQANIKNVARVEVELKLAKDKQPIAAGSELKIVATASNKGTRTIHRLRGILHSEHPAFKGREFMFGKLEPGQSRVWSVDSKIPKEAASRSDVLKIELHADHQPLEKAGTLSIVTKHIPHPQFAYAYAIDDTKRGDGDGVLELGEGIDFMVFVTNTGSGDADEVSLRLKSGAKERLFLERGRVKIGAIKAGETRSQRLKFRVPQNPSSAKEELPLELTIFDTVTGQWMEDQFALTATKKRKAKASGRKKAGVSAKRRTLIYSAADSAASVLATTDKGARFASDRRVGDFTRVALVDDSFGWIKTSEVRGARAPRTVSKGIHFQPRRRPPTIALNGKVAGSVVEEKEVKLSGTVSGRALRDMYVLLNSKKVYFASGPKAASSKAQKAQPWTKPDENAVKLPFSVNLELEDGLNKVLIVARLDEKVISYENVYISRRSVEVAKARKTGPATSTVK